MDKTTKLRPIEDLAKTIKIAGENYGWGTFAFEHVAIVLQNFRTLVFQIFPQDALQNLKLKDVGDYNISFFNSGDGQKIHVIFKDALLQESFAAIEGLKIERKNLQNLDAAISILQQNVAQQQAQVIAMNEELLNLKAVATIALENHINVTAINSDIQESTKNLRVAKATLEHSKRSLEDMLENSRLAKIKFNQDKEHASKVAYDCIQLDGNNIAHYGRNITENNFNNLEEVLAEENLHFEGQDDSEVLKSKELRKRIFLTLIDLERIAQELLVQKDESRFFQAVVASISTADVTSTAQKVDMTSSAAQKLEQVVATDFSIFSEPAKFEKAVRFIKVRPTTVAAGEDLPPVGLRPTTAKFNGAATLPKIAEKSKAKMAWTGGSSDDSDNDEEEESFQPKNRGDDGAGSAHYSDDFEEESHSETDEEDERKEEVEESLQQAEEVRIAEEEVAALDELSKDVAGLEIYFEQDENVDNKPSKTATSPSNAASTLTAGQETKIKKYLADLVERAKNSRTKLAQKSQENEQNKLGSNNIWNFAKYIYRTWLNEGKKSINNKNGYYNIMNRGTATANNEGDIIIILKTTSNPLIFHCARTKIQILELDPKTKKPNPIAVFDEAKENKIFFNFVDRIADIKGLSEVDKKKIFQGDQAVEKKPQRPTTTRPTTSKSLAGAPPKRASGVSPANSPLGGTNYGASYRSPYTQSGAAAASAETPKPSPPKTAKPPILGRPNTGVTKPGAKAKTTNLNDKKGAENSGSAL